MSDRTPIDAVFRLEHLSVRYGSVRAVEDLSLVCPPGAVGLLGPNGAGKSSVLKAVLGLVPRAKGRIEVLGHPVPQEALEVRRRIGYMPESPGAFPGMTGFESVAYAGVVCGMPRGEARRRAHEVLEYVGLGEERYRGVEEYSTGMRQKAKLACALVHDPDLLLLDEPTNGLDPQGRIDILQLVRDLSHQKNLHLVLSSHLLQDVEAVCDSVLVIAAGALRAEGSIEELRARLSGRRLRVTLTRGAEAFAAALEREGIEAVRTDPLDPGDLVLEITDDSKPRRVLELAAETGAQIRRFVPRTASLEEVFLQSLDPAPAAGGAH